MKYKHITELSKHEEASLFAKCNDLADEVIEIVADKYKEDQIDSCLIRGELHKLLKNMDEVVDTDTFYRYKLVERGVE